MYSLCRDTVTLYRCQGDTVQRRVLENCDLHIQDKQVEDPYSAQLERAFLLVLPGQQDVLPGDRVMGGVGPEIDRQQWDTFVPGNVAGLCQVQYVQPFYCMGMLCHTEAGRKALSGFC